MPTARRPARAPAPTPAAGYARTVRGQGPALLLAPGIGPSAAATFELVLAGLAAAHTVIASDYPGTGRTPRATAPLALDEVADQFAAVAQAEGQRSFAVVGNALGAAVAVRIAQRHPDRVRALVLTTPLAIPDPGLLAAIATWRGLHTRGEPEALSEFLVRTTLGAHALRALGADPCLREFALAQFANASPAGAPEQLDLLAALDLRKDLATLTQPTLVLITAQDGFVDPLTQREAAAAIPGATHIYLPTGHLALAEAPALWLAHTTDFLCCPDYRH